MRHHNSDRYIFVNGVFLFIKWNRISATEGTGGSYTWLHNHHVVHKCVHYIQWYVKLDTPFINKANSVANRYYSTVLRCS